MLTEPDKLLITAAVDGELTPAEAKAFDRLLASSPEAGRLYRRLKANAARLAALPRRAAPAGLASGVMARVRPATPGRKPAPARRSFLPYAVAASLFLTVVVGSALLLRKNTDRDQQADLPPPGQPIVPDVSTGDVVAFAKPGLGEDGVVKPSDDGGAVARVEPTEPKADVVVKLPPPLTPEEKELFGVGLMVESKPLKKIDSTLPVLFDAREFDKEEPQARLKKELARDGGFRLNLFSKNAAAATEHLQSAARNSGVHVFVEGNTAKRLKESQFPLSYAVYVENLTADELAALLAELSKQVNGQSRPEALLGSAHFVPADVHEQKDLKELLGLDWALPKAKPTDGKAVSEGTLKEVVASVKKPGEKAAVVVTFLGKQNAGKSAEAKQFVEKRGERKPGTVPLLIVIRQQG